MAIQRLRVEWSGTSVEGAGVTTFYADADGTMAIQVGAGGFFDEVLDLLPPGTTITIPAGGDVLDESTGTITGAWGGGSSTVKTQSLPQAYAAGVGARVVWETGGIRNGRRVKGSTFVLPLGNTCYENDGSLTAATITALDAACAAMLAQVPTQMRVWSRPTATLPGVAHPVLGYSVPDKVSWLRSRRT